RHLFTPQPKVDSAVLRMDIRKEKPVEVRDEKVFFQCIKAGFGQRRKTLLNSLQTAGGLGKEQVEEALSEAGIDKDRRAETLTIEEFAKLADCFAQRL
ncbi:MAG: 16S rRNA (adenine(1518)-N(6)/adenine(1519)-N(6))-dimethyltransferase, partial [Firmicutes bacterium]|nr:16S rRNA (adenine(1518)-N(6)/adenine(1519)-N(6))-dimethyltransferase [Bacillota bacterium]